MLMLLLRIGFTIIAFGLDSSLSSFKLGSLSQAQFPPILILVIKLKDIEKLKD